MSVDLRLEQFSVDLFRHLWNKCGIESSISERPKDYGDETSYDCTPEIIHAVYCRDMLGMGYQGSFFFENYEQYSRNGVDFLYFLHNYMRSYNYILPYLNIFDKLFTTSAFVVKMCYYCHINNNNTYKNIGPLCWAMYFEGHFIEEFYDAGGLEELKKYAKAYNVELLKSKYLLTLTPENMFYYYYNYVNNYYRFEKVIHHFKQLVSTIIEDPCCYKCFPLYQLLFLWSYPNTSRDILYPLVCVEGCIQLFIRMLSTEEIEDIVKKVSDSEIQIMQESDPSLMAAKSPSLMNTLFDFKDISTVELCKRLFTDLNSEELDPKRKFSHCIFCGADKNAVHEKQYYLKKDFFDKIAKIKRFIRRTVSKVKSSEREEKVRSKDESHSFTHIRIRNLSHAMGVKTANNRVLHDIKEECESSHEKDVQEMTSYMMNIKIKDDSAENALKNKKKRIRKKGSKSEN